MGNFNKPLHSAHGTASSLEVPAGDHETPQQALANTARPTREFSHFQTTLLTPKNHALARRPDNIVRCGTKLEVLDATLALLT